MTNADRVYGSPNAPAHHITAPAQPPRLMPGRVSGLVIGLVDFEALLFATDIYHICYICGKPLLGAKGSPFTTLI